MTGETKKGYIYVEYIQCYYFHAEKLSVRFLNQPLSLVTMMFVVTLP